MAIKTPLGRALGLGSAKDGTDHFIRQRITALANILLGCWFLYAMLRIDSLAYLEFVRFIAEPWHTVLMSLLCVSVAYHSSLGIQVVIEDYVHTSGVKKLALIASRFAHVLLAVASVYAVLRIGLSV